MGLIKVYDKDDKIIKTQSTMKSLGFILNARGTLESHLSKTKARIGYEYSKLKPYLNLMTQADRKLIVNAKLRSILDYGTPLFISETEGTKSKLEAAHMTLNRIIHGGLTFKVNNVKICKHIGSQLPSKYMHKISARYIHKHLFKKQCPSVIEKLIIPKRDASIIYMKNPQLGVYPASLDKLILMYNKLPLATKSMKPQKFKKYLVKNDLNQN